MVAGRSDLVLSPRRPQPGRQPTGRAGPPECGFQRAPPLTAQCRNRLVYLLQYRQRTRRAALSAEISSAPETAGFLNGPSILASSEIDFHDRSERGVIAGAFAATARSAEWCSRSTVPCADPRNAPAAKSQLYREAERGPVKANHQSTADPGPAGRRAGNQPV